MKKLNIFVSIFSCLLALAALLVFCCAKCVAGVGGTNLVEAGLLALTVASVWVSLWLATRPAEEPIAMAVPCPRCGAGGFDRELCDLCVDDLSWEQVADADLDFHAWLAENEEDLAEEANLLGLSGEADFDFESWAEARFFKSK